MDRYDHSDMYDYAYHPRKWCLIVVSFVILVVTLFVVLYFGIQLYNKAPAKVVPPFLKIVSFLILLIVYFIFIVLMLINSLSALYRVNKIVVGINKDGLFIRYAGMFDWDRIKSVTLQKSFGIVQGKLYIQTDLQKDPKFQMSMIWFLFFYYILDKLRIGFDGTLIITECDVPISLAKLQKILMEYKVKYGDTKTEK